jgi:uncharacterized protein DUF5666
MKTTLVAAGTLAVLVACGGGGSSGSMSQTGAQSVATWGTITAFGSVYVNGVRYDVSRATLKKNDTTVAQTGLAVGEVALVRGREDTQTGQGEADSVDVEDSVVGPIKTIDLVKNQLTVLGQTISVTANTSFGAGITPADLKGLTSKDSVEVSGLPGMDGVIMATRIGRAESTEPLQVLGTVASVGAMHTLMINALTVDFSAANPSGFAPAPGDLVIARGTLFNDTTMTLTATALRLANTDRDEQAAGGLVEEEGVITSVSPAASGMGLDLVVAGAKVTTKASTVFKGGVATDLAVNVRVEVRGTLDANKTLVADVVEIEHIAVIGLLGTASVKAMALTVLGVPITVDANTRFEDRSSPPVAMFTLTDVKDGDTVLVRGYESPAGSGTVLARRLERLPASTVAGVAGVRGPFTATTAPQFKILSITIDATSATFGKGEEGATLSSADFFTQAVGQIVDVVGTATGNTVMAKVALIDTEEDR